MDILNDDEWLVIFKMLNLNERANLRLVSKKFKSLLDTIKITKLIIYEKMPPFPGQLMHINEPYGLQDTAGVYDLNKFFNNPTIRSQMKSIEKLMIEGFRRDVEIKLNNGFKKLTYLKLRNVVFTNAGLLQSAKIEHLILQFSYFKPIAECTAHLREIKRTDYINRSTSVFNYQFNKLKTRKLKYLHLPATEIAFLRYCVGHGLFNSLEVIDITVFDFESLQLLNDRCPTLKTINCQVGVNCETFYEQVDKMEGASERLRDDLSVYLFGIPFNKASAKPIVDFVKQIKQFGDCLEISNSAIEFQLKQGIYDCIKRFERDYDLSRFYQLFTTISIFCFRKDVNFHNKFNQCQTLCFLQPESPDFYFNECPGLLSKVERMNFITTQNASSYGNDIFDQLPKYCAHLVSLTIQNTSKINFNFLHSLARLCSVRFKLCFPVEQSEFMQLIRTSKHLCFVDISYVVAELTDSIRAELSKLKREVNDCVKNELKKSTIEFKIEIHKKHDYGTFIRYVLRAEIYDEGFSMEKEDEDSMFEMCRYMCTDRTYIRVVI